MTPLFSCIYNLSQTKDLALNIYHYILTNNIKIVKMRGEMGSGKTTFIKVLLSTLDPQIEVTSPTYNYVNEYYVNKKYIWHFDLYRVEDKDSLLDLGIIDYLNREDGIAFIEWSEKCMETNVNNYKSIILHFFHIENKDERAFALIQ